jgi:hypothetical protein
MKKIILFLIFPFLTFAQIEKTIKLKVAVVQEIVKKGAKAETEFWQTKGKVTFAIVNYTNEQNPIFKELFIKQFQEILPVYNKMIVSYDEKDTDLFVKILIRQEDDYRNLLTKPQLQLYLDKLADFEKNNPQQNDAYSSLFFSEKLLKEYKFKFGYNEKTPN